MGEEEEEEGRRESGWFLLLKIGEHCVQQMRVLLELDGWMDRWMDDTVNKSSEFFGLYSERFGLIYSW